MRYYQIGEAAELTKRDIASIEAHIGRCCEKCFPKIYEGGPRPSYMEAIRSWFTLVSGKENGRDHCAGRWQGAAPGTQDQTSGSNRRGDICHKPDRFLQGRDTYQISGDIYAPLKSIKHKTRKTGPFLFQLNCKMLASLYALAVDKKGPVRNILFKRLR